MIFPPSNLPQEEQIFIPYIDDGINEAEEGFLVIIEIDDTQTDPATVGFVNEGVALMLITNDDGITLFVCVCMCVRVGVCGCYVVLHFFLVHTQIFD